MKVSKIEDRVYETLGSRWRIGASTLPYPHDPVKAVKELLGAGIGLKRMEIALAEPLERPENTAEKLNGLKHRYGLRYSVHAPFLYDDLAHPHQGLRGIYVDEAKRAIDFAANIDARTVVLHPGHLSIRRALPPASALEPLYKPRKNYLQNSRQSLEALAEHALPRKTKLLVENLPSGLCEGQEDVQYLLSSLENAEFLLDTGHANVSGALAELLDLRPKYFHFHDNDGKNDQHLQLGEGTIDLTRLVTKLKGYEGGRTVIFELYSVEDVLNSLEIFTRYLGL